jgi:DNA-binding SARP family transcriptional activator
LRRRALAALALAAGDAVDPERMADAMWGETLPASARKVVQNHVLALRRTSSRFRPRVALHDTNPFLSRPRP